MEEGVNGTVTSLASMLPADEARKAAACMQDAIAEKRQELDRVRGFVADNAGPVGLVQKLPEELHHDAMDRSDYVLVVIFSPDRRGSRLAGGQQGLGLALNETEHKTYAILRLQEVDAKLGDAKDVVEAIRKAMLEVLDFLYVTPNLKGFEAAAAAGAEEVAAFASASESFFQLKHKWQHGGES